MRAVIETPTGFVISEVDLEATSLKDARREASDIVLEMDWPSLVVVRIIDGSGLELDQYQA